MHFASLCFLTGIALYAYGVLNVVHELFHKKRENFLSRYFPRFYRWIDEIHEGHHADQGKNYTIFFPLMDLLCASYFFKPQREALKKTAQVCGISISDVINWKYLLLYARPSIKARFIADVKRIGRGRLAEAKLEALLGLLSTLTEAYGPLPQFIKLRKYAEEFLQQQRQPVKK